ncbi:MAG: amidohydrolase family protein, partial [Candidatus Nanoarchaeia archaeon]
MRYDYIIKNALIADGISEQLFISSVGITNGKISCISDLLNTSHAKSVIDAQGKLLCPGFIDVHSHSDISIISSEQNIGKISQGFTTEVIGNCGLSAFPITDN